MNKLILYRIYENPNQLDGFKVLIDRLWPRGIKKEYVNLNLWAKEFSPSSSLRKEFHHEEDKFEDFKNNYIEELNNNPYAKEFIDVVMKELNEDDVVFLYGAKDKKHNNAVVLKDWVENKLAENGVEI